MEKPVIIFGSKGIAKAALEIFNSNGVDVYGFLDDDKKSHDTEINTVPVLGDTEDHGFLKLIGQKCEAFVATDDNKERKEYVDYLIETRKVMPVNAIHETAYLSKSFAFGHGNFINAKCILTNNSAIGNHCIINSGVVIEQDVTISNFVQIGAGTTVNSGVTIEESVFVGSGVTIVSGVKIGKNARIGAGSVVVGDVEENQTVFGNPAVEVK